MIGIYLITNKITNQHYVGQSIDIKERINRHRWHPSNCGKIDKDIRTYGWENFEWKVLEECDSCLLNEREKYWISYYDSYNTGYNCTTGGKGSSNAFLKLNEQTVHEIQKLLIDNKITQLQIATMFNVSKDFITDINLGRAHYRQELTYPLRNHIQPKSVCQKCGKLISKDCNYCDACNRLLSRKVDRPSAETLLEDIKTLGFTGTGRKYGVTDNAIRKWCKSYGLPYRKKDL